MIYQPPAGARDLLPVDVAQKRWIEERLRPIFRRWGYHRIITSTLERLDTLMAGGAIDRSTVIQFQDTDDELLGLRPELTASIARTVVTRMGDRAFPQRLYYNANVFRRATDSRHGRQQEFYQAGVELLGAGGTIADAEILLLVTDCLQSLGLQQWSVILGEAELTRSLIDPFPEPVQAKVRRAIAHLDRVALETMPLSPELRDRALLLFDLRGRPEQVLQKLGQLELNRVQQDALDRIKALLELLAARDRLQGDSDSAVLNSIVLDLSWIQPFNYYTGIVFEVVGDTESGARILGQGGRYDRLLGLYHPQGETFPGIGFSLNIEDLHQALKPTGQLPDRTPPSHYLVVPKTPQAQAAAFACAWNLRQSTELIRVEVELGLNETPDAIRDYARQRSIRKIAWVAGDGVLELETVG